MVRCTIQNGSLPQLLQRYIFFLQKVAEVDSESEENLSDCVGIFFSRGEIDAFFLYLHVEIYFPQL